MRDLTDIRPEWTEHNRIHEAYLCMAKKAKHRPQTPSDGLGHILLSDAELADPDRLKVEASDYAERFIKEEDTSRFNIGVSNYPTNRAFVYTIEAAKLLCTGSADRRAAKLLGMALKDVKAGTRRRRRRWPMRASCQLHRPPLGSRGGKARSRKWPLGEANPKAVNAKFLLSG